MFIEGFPASGAVLDAPRARVRERVLVLTPRAGASPWGEYDGQVLDPAGRPLAGKQLAQAQLRLVPGVAQPGTAVYVAGYQTQALAAART